jgi:hypothetical protein
MDLAKEIIIRRARQAPRPTPQTRPLFSSSDSARTYRRCSVLNLYSRGSQPPAAPAGPRPGLATPVAGASPPSEPDPAVAHVRAVVPPARTAGPSYPGGLRDDAPHGIRTAKRASAANLERSPAADEPASRRVASFSARTWQRQRSPATIQRYVGGRRSAKSKLADRSGALTPC